MAKSGVEDIRFTAFTEAKLRAWFKMRDVNKDGYMSKEDYLLFAQRFVKEYSLSGKKAQEIQDWLLDTGKHVLDLACDEQQETLPEVKATIPQFLAMGHNLRAGVKVSEDDFAAAWGQLISQQPQLAERTMEKMFGAFFEIFDQNSDDYISEDEMQRGLRCFGYEKPDEVKKAFVSLDLNQDGWLSRQEYVGGWTGFLLSQDKQQPFLEAFAPWLAG